MSLRNMTRSVKKYGLWYAILVVKNEEFIIGVFDDRIDADEILEKGMALRQNNLSGKQIKTILNKP